MPLYELTSDAFRPINTASFAELKIRERDDLQRMLRSQIEVLGDELYVLTEEFGEWEDSRRRIDLLAIDADANLVVIELKRTTDGGHMELQAIRYAAMVSTMTFERAEQVHAEFLARSGKAAKEARTRILTFLGWEEPQEESFAQDVRIILVSEDFSKELTTAVLWLREREIDIRCIRLRPYLDGTTRFVDVQQIIPLPEANEYQIQIRQKEQVGRRNRAERIDERLKFWEGLIALCRERGTRHADRKPGYYHWLGVTSGTPGLGLNYVLGQDEAAAELYIDRGDGEENERIFDRLQTSQKQIEQAFGEPLTWERLDGRRACRIKHVITAGGFRSPEPTWPTIQVAMVEAMSRLERALMPHLEALDL
ncbi:MAG: DUF4268 domain-containing protein [Pirellulales bacterium]